MAPGTFFAACYKSPRILLVPPVPTTRTFHVVIVGAGIAGIATSIALAKKGHRVTLVEATSELRPMGGTIILQANANRVLDHLDICQRLFNDASAGPYWASTRRYTDGKCLIKMPLEAHENAYGYP